MSNVVSIDGAPVAPLGEPDFILVAKLEALLEMARSGQLQSFVGVGFTAQGERVSCWGGVHRDVDQMLGSLVWLQHEYIDAVTGEVKQESSS